MFIIANDCHDENLKKEAISAEKTKPKYVR
jgi:hypothetical protein